jgi:HD-like signal output (HDOD) protein/CRP-like cAMP-binding protein
VVFGKIQNLPPGPLMTLQKNTESDPSQQIQFLSKIPFFQDFDDHEIKQFLAVSRWLKVPANTLVIREGDTQTLFYILVKGQVSIFKTMENGKILELTKLKTGACFGEMALVSETKRTAGVEALTDSYLLMVDPKIVSRSSVFLQLKFYKRFCEIMVQRLDLANRRMAGQEGRTRPASAGAASIASLLQREPLSAATASSPEFGSPADKLQTSRQGGQSLSLPPMPEKMGRIDPATLKSGLQNDHCLAIDSAIVGRLDALSRGSGDPTRQFAELIALDPVMSAKVLQVANSPFYRRTCPVYSVPHAVVIVGARQLQKMFTETLQTGQGIRPFGEFVQLTRQFRRHCLVVGRIAELLKEVISLDLSADIYLAGLLHDLGMLALARREPRFYPQLLRTDSELATHLEASEISHLGTSHSTAGQWLGEHLGLPEVYLEVMRWHHQPEKAQGEFALPVALVHLADLFAADRGLCLGGQKRESNLLESFGWALIRDQHPPFLDVNLSDFLASFNSELDKGWHEITGGFDG